MNIPIISIVIPVYNVENFLSRTIESILAQTFKDFELILVDDGSPDASGEVCDSYACKDTRVRVFHNENSGAYNARMYGVSQAKGQWIMFIDADDTIPPTACSDLLNLDTDNYDILIGTLNLNNKDVYKHKRIGVLDKLNYIEALLLGDTSKGPCAKLFKRELFSNKYICPKHITNNEDLLMILNISTKIEKVYITNIKCYNYLFRDESTSKSKCMNVSAWFNLFDEIESNLVEELKSSKIKYAFLKYRLRILKIVTTFHGYRIKSNDKRLQYIIKDAEAFELSVEDKNNLCLLLSECKQRLFYYKNKLIFNIVKIIKNILK